LKTGLNVKEGNKVAGIEYKQVWLYKFTWLTWSFGL